MFQLLPLRNLNLIKNVLTDEQIGPVSKTLKENTNIQQIFMSHNRMSVAAMQTLADGLKDNKVLTDFFFQITIFLPCLAMDIKRIRE